MSTTPHPAGQPTPGTPAPEPEAPTGTGNFWMDLLIGVATQSWLASKAFHMALMVVLALIMGTIHVATIGDAPTFDAASESLDLTPDITNFEVGDTPLDPSVLDTDSLMLTEAPSVDALTDKSPVFEPEGGGLAEGDSKFGGLGTITIPSLNLGPALKGAGGIDIGAGSGQ